MTLGAEPPLKQPCSLLVVTINIHNSLVMSKRNRNKHMSTCSQLCIAAALCKDNLS
jgi:hypothetical protein